MLLAQDAVEKNVAADPAYAKTKAEYAARLMKQLTEAKDPRVTGDGQTFERPPFSGPLSEDAAGKGQKKKAAKKAE